MNRVNEMIYALRKCAKEHEDEVIYTGQIMTTSLCRDVADYLEADQWHYPSRGEYPKEDEEVLCELLDGTHDVGKYCPSKYKEYQEYEPPWDFGDYLEDYIECWQYIVSPKEER